MRWSRVVIGRHLKTVHCKLRSCRCTGRQSHESFVSGTEYLCLVAVIGGAVVFAEYRLGWGLSWWWNVPVFTAAVILIGGLQHRLAGLGHESSHYSFMKNRHLNDLIPDLFCMFPLMTTIHFYRLFHFGHHQYTNDPARSRLVEPGPRQACR